MVKPNYSQVMRSDPSPKTTQFYEKLNQQPLTRRAREGLTATQQATYDKRYGHLPTKPEPAPKKKRGGKENRGEGLGHKKKARGIREQEPAIRLNPDAGIDI